MEGLLIAEPAGREMRGHLWPQRRSAAGRAPLQCIGKAGTLRPHQTQVQIPELPPTAKPLCCEETRFTPSGALSPGSLPVE